MVHDKIKNNKANSHKLRTLKKQVRSDNDASEVDISGHLGHLGTFWDNSENFLKSLEHLDCFPSHFRPFSFIISSLKKMRDGRTDGRMDPLIEMRGRIKK